MDYSKISLGRSLGCSFAYTCDFEKLYFLHNAFSFNTITFFLLSKMLIQTIVVKRFQKDKHIFGVREGGA